MKNLILAISFLFLGACHSIYANNPPEKVKIQVSLLLDTSSSMDGLIEQAKSRLWNIVNVLTTLKYQGETPRIEIALYEYGNDRLSRESSYIRQVTPLTADLDLISEKLFALQTDGGLEYCGTVIRDAMQDLAWDDHSATIKLIYIAGNEGFNQGNISYKEIIRKAVQQNIYVNTIYCGGHREGIELYWKDGADIGKGKYFHIDHNARVSYIATPYDEQIRVCNEKLNHTYISYGATGASKKQNQMMQDQNAETISASNYAERAISKSKAIYKNESWDLVDKCRESEQALDEIKSSELPKELQNKSKEEVKKIVAEKTKERELVQQEIKQLAKKRQTYIEQEAKKQKEQDDLGQAINTSIVEFAKSKGYEVH